MTKAQEHLLMLFKEIADICHKHGIIYYMAGGTLIGAVRHKGFIPWDDDMDILMTRDNWHKFIEVTRTDMPDNRVLECQELNRNYPNMFGRYTDTTSTAIHKNQVLGDGIAGYVVDILVLDPVPDREASYKKYREDLMLYSDLVNPSLNYSYRWGINKKRFKKYYSKMKRFGKDAVLSQLEEEMFCYDEAECELYAMRWGGAPFLFEKSMYGSSRWGVFEGVKCRIPDRTGDYLTWHYGDDWMYIPPHGEHESHEAIFSFTTDYKTIQNDYLRYLDVPKIRKSLIKRKLYYFRHMEQRLSAKDMVVKIMAEAAKVELQEALGTLNNDLERMLAEEKYTELSDFFSKYYADQGSRQCIGREDYLGIYRFHNPVLVDIDDSVLYIAVMTLIHTNRIAKAARFIEVREWVKGDLSGKLVDAKELIGLIRSAISSYDLGDKEEAYQQVEILFHQYPHNLSLIMFRVRLLLEFGNYETAKEEIDRAIKIYPNDGYFYKYLGDYYYDFLSDIKGAYELYDKAIELTNNGIVLLEIKERIYGDKENLLKEIKDNRDLDKCLLILRLSPDDMDFSLLKCELMLSQSRNEDQLIDLLKYLKSELHRFEGSYLLKNILEQTLIQLGEDDICVALRTDLIYATTVKEYQELQKKLEHLCKENPDDGNYFKLLGDTNNWLGQKSDARNFYNDAITKKHSSLVKYELKEGVLS